MLYKIVLVLVAVACLTTEGAAKNTSKSKPKKPKLRMAWLSQLTEKDVANIKNPDEVAILEISITQETGKKKPVFDQMAILSVARFHNLKTLTIWSDELEYIGLKNLSEIGSLEAILLYKPKISARGIKHLSKLKNLKTLGLYEPIIEPEDIKKLEKLLPDVLIEFYSPKSKNGKVFDRNGCPATWFRRRHLRLDNFQSPKPLPGSQSMSPRPLSLASLARTNSKSERRLR